MALNKQLSNTQDLVAIEEIHDNTVILKSGAMRQVLMVGGMNTALKSEEELNLITTSYQNFLNSLDFSIQIIVHSRKVNIEKYLSGLEERRRLEQSAILQSQISEYKEFIAGFVRENDIMEKTFLVVVPFSPSGLAGVTSASGVAKLFPFFGAKGDAKEVKVKEGMEKEASFKESLGQLNQRVNQIVEGLRAIDLDAAVLGDEELIELFYNFYNPETVERGNLNVPVEKNEGVEGDEVENK
ncbi:MAG: hypothetical protein G01um101420_6 [Parcubacteria group bacterium Gr01-1014_20]|nr:MAG: hypothetical protein G01um101420_6 [Parcubacteria group bacterium Gr01-1014_20]